MNITHKTRLDRSFFNRHTVDVARDLLGKILVWRSFCGFITETEAYCGMDDPASHAFKKTPRASIMFGIAGMSYVYMIYGIYYCLNISTEDEGIPGGVLIRGISLFRPHNRIIEGPGKICRELDITRVHNNIDLTNTADYYLMSGKKITHVNVCTRIGIKAGKDKLWRFLVH